MPIIRWKPFEELDKILEDFPSFRAHTWDLAADVYEEDDNVIVEMHIPGIDPDKVEIDVEDTYLHVSGSREEKEEVEDEKYYHKEIRRGSFERVIHLPARVVQEEARAEFKDGVLKVTLPKEQVKKTKKIKVRRG
jgi:HSP20 family protein